MKKITKEIAKEFERRTISESLNRIKICTSKLTQEELWRRPNENLVSIGNLIMHLNGNVKQWILSGVGLEKDLRQRDLEFENNHPIAKEDLIEDLEKTLKKSLECIQSLSDDQLLVKRKVQCYEETVLSIILHVIEHFSYHVGQITYYTKYLKNIDTGYYKDDPLNKRSN